MGVGRRRKSDWTPAQIKLMKKLYRETSTWEIANRLDKSPSEVKRMAVSLRLKKLPGRKRSD